MPDPAELYEIVGDRELSPDSSPVLLHALDGFLDAGSVAQIAANHLVETLEGTVVAKFDIDLLHDYRARRPPMTFVEDHYESYTPPQLLLHELKDSTGAPFFLLNGPEPDVMWERFTTAVGQLADHFGVRMVVGLGGVPMTIPHTRPTTLTTHGTRPDLVRRPNVWRGNLRVPGSASALLELRLGEAGKDAIGFVAHVPHYLASVEFPQASAALLDAVAEETGLLLPVGSLHAAGVTRLREIDAQLADDPQAVGVVKALEEQYDSFVANRQQAELGGELDENVPSGEELGAELERFLAQLERGDDDTR
ncbi:PAC2 family protein [Cryptosporangium phraense]|uniref:PAC2 family protein n=1 Tax=Cryptosporangium phraense TaxID=2593070 RepID=A0A545AEA1_9ACTN|nr:PAC2 family protein [Cryptosporangium phraense]TQS39666.1 PAC2 family protein [Cryptosporangium phraense]